MRSTIFIPKIIHVGYQNRKDTYTGKLAYIIYTDEKGVKRKQASWDSWRDDNIEPNTFDNVPTAGFVLNKKVGDTQSHWNFRQAYCRVYDPRGFEFEITIENLLYILENTNSIVGKGLEGDFVYGWDGKDLILIPTNSVDYKEIMAYTNLMYDKDFKVTAKTLKEGTVYRDKNNYLYMYIGKAPNYLYTSYSEVMLHDIESNGNAYWFAKFNSFEDYESCKGFTTVEEVNAESNFNNYGRKIHYDSKKTISSKTFIEIFDEVSSEFYASVYEDIQSCSWYSATDPNNVEIIPYTLDEFTKKIVDLCTIDKHKWREDFYFCSQLSSEIHQFKFEAEFKYEHYADLSSYKLQSAILSERDNRDYVNMKFGTYYSSGRYIQTSLTTSYNYKETPTKWQIEDMYNTLKPCYVQTYLLNGRKASIYNCYEPDLRKSYKQLQNKD